MTVVCSGVPPAPAPMISSELPTEMPPAEATVSDVEPTLMVPVVVTTSLRGTRMAGEAEKWSGMKRLYVAHLLFPHESLILNPLPKKSACGNLPIAVFRCRTQEYQSPSKNDADLRKVALCLNGV